MTKARAKYLRKVWYILWYTNWTNGDQLKVLDRLIFGTDVKVLHGRVTIRHKKT